MVSGELLRIGNLTDFNISLPLITLHTKLSNSVGVQLVSINNYKGATYL